MAAPDVVYVVRPGHRNEELRYSLRTVAAHLPHRRVWLAGHCPRWARDVGCIPLPQTGTRFGNSTANLRAAAEHPDVTEEFVLMNDDFFLMRPLDRVPVLHRGPIDRVEAQYAARGSGDYLRGLRETRALLAELGHQAPVSYELHVPMPMTKTRVLEALDTGRHLDVLHKRTLYGVMHEIGGRQIPDCKVLTYSPQFPKDAPFLSTLPATFAGGEVGRFIRSRFTSACRYEQGGKS